MTKKILMLLGVVLIFTSCSLFDSGSILIDNPTDTKLQVFIDGQEYTVPSQKHIKVDLTEGEHKLTCEAYGLKDEPVEVPSYKAGIINPTKAKYVQYNIIFTQKDIADQFKPYDVEGKEIYSLLGAPVVFTDLFIPDLTQGSGNLDNDPPTSVSYNSLNQDYGFQMKLFRLNDFFEFYNKHDK